MLLGTPPIEFQLRRARAAGAGHAVIFVERVSPALLASVDRLRAEGLSVDVARTVGDAAEYVHPDENVLLVASDLIVDTARIDALVASKSPILLCVRDEPANAEFELIDPTARWTGFALIDGGLVRRTAALVGDWDLGSTMLRCAVQEGAARMTLTPDEAASDLVVLKNSGDGQSAGRILLGATASERAGWGQHWLIGPMARLAARFAGDAGVEAKYLSLAALGLFGIAAFCSLVGWVPASLFLFMIALLGDVAGAFGARAGAGPAPYEFYRYPVRAGSAALVGIATGVTLSLRTLQWGCFVLSLVVVGATWLGASLARTDARAAQWRADPAGHALIVLAGFAVGSPVGALAIAAAHAAASLGWAQKRAGQA